MAPQALPTDDDRTALVHGDLRVDNMLFSARDANNPAPPAVEAVLDWELSTLGHPSADLALATLPYLSPRTCPAPSAALSARRRRPWRASRRRRTLSAATSS